VVYIQKWRMMGIGATIMIGPRPCSSYLRHQASPLAGSRRGEPKAAALPLGNDRPSGALQLIAVLRASKHSYGTPIVPNASSFVEAFPWRALLSVVHPDPIF
jgi:hypothetical protein